MALSLSSVCFERKLQFSTSQDLCFARSKFLKHLPETQNGNDVWNIKPPDFSLKLYTSLSVPQKKEKRIQLLNASKLQPSETKRKTGLYLPTVFNDSAKRKDPAKFVTSYRPPDALESELMFVQAGKHPSESYKNPKPHNFRLLDETLPDIVTTYERDPGNLKLKLKHLGTLRTINAESDFSSRQTQVRMDTFRPTDPKWDARLILPQPPFPPKSASYTRHRRRRGVYSAFLDRVEEKLTRSWKNGPSYVAVCNQDG